MIALETLLGNDERISVEELLNSKIPYRHGDTICTCASSSIWLTCYGQWKGYHGEKIEDGLDDVYFIVIWL